MSYGEVIVRIEGFNKLCEIPLSSFPNLEEVMSFIDAKRDQEGFENPLVSMLNSNRVPIMELIDGHWVVIGKFSAQSLPR